MRVLFVGGHGHHYLRQAVRRDLAEAVGWASDGVDADAARKRAGDLPYHDDYRAAIDALQPDVVSIGAVYAHNGRLAAEAIERGRSVVADKPLAASFDDLDRIETACAAKPDAVVLTEFNLRSDPAFRAARLAVERGRIGRVALATAQKSYRFGAARPDFYKRREDYGGTLLWVASHGIDAVWYVTGLDLLGATGNQGNVARRDYEPMEDHVSVCLDLAEGAHAVVHADYLRPASAPTHGDDRIRVVGSRGQVEVRDGMCTLITADSGPTDITAEGAAADIAADLLAALGGADTVYATARSLRMARWLLACREATDQRRWLELT